MKKKLLAFVMAATMVFSLAACGSSSSNDSSNSGSSSDSAQSGDEVQTFKMPFSARHGIMQKTNRRLSCPV